MILQFYKFHKVGLKVLQLKLNSLLASQIQERIGNVGQPKLSLHDSKWRVNIQPFEKFQNCVPEGNER